MKRKGIAAGIFLGLGISYWCLREVPFYTAYPSPEKRITLPVKPETTKKRKLKATASYHSHHQEEDDDEYRTYLNSLELLPSFFCQNQEISELKEDCNEQEIRELHDQKYKPPSKIHEMVDLDCKLANCKYASKEYEWRKLIQEAVEHYALVGNFNDAGRVCYFMGDLDCAITYFSQDKHTAEEAIALTSADQLIVLRDRYLDQDEFLSAGKVEWVLGNKERARELITQSPDYRWYLQETSKSVTEGWYGVAIMYLWRGTKSPFFRETFIHLCQDNEECLKVARKYSSIEDTLPVLEE